jgi:hypothetical protein
MVEQGNLKRFWCKFTKHDWRVYPLCEHELTPWAKKCSRCGELHIGRKNMDEVIYGE